LANAALDRVKYCFSTNIIKKIIEKTENNKMRKTIIVSSILLICSLMLSSTPLIFGNFASATTGAANFLPNLSYYPPQGFDTQNEEQLSLSTAQYITTKLANKYPTSYFSAYGATCTLSNYRTVTSYLQNYDYAVIYSKGHRGMTGQHISLLDNGGTGFLDLDIDTRTSYNKNRFTFIWHCETALYYNNNGQSNTDTLGQAIGMPFAYTHNNYLPKYSGGSGHQVYLGWVNKNNFAATYPNGTQVTYPVVGSPQYEWKANAGYNHADVAKQFWNNMEQNLTTKNALDAMSRTIYGNSVPFTSSNLSNWLIVYGNWDLKLPT
jgi:hypothetical protein